MEIITVTPENIGDEHICCGFSDKKCAGGYNAKKNWLKTQYEKGYRFKKMDIRGKVFIEYGPAESGFSPVHAPGYLLINCFWVAGKYKGQGYGKKLLEEALKDAQEMNGIITITTKKKMPYLSDKKFLMKYGFEVCDTAPPYFELMVANMKEGAPKPVFTESAKLNTSSVDKGMTVYYSDRCVFAEYYIETELKRLAEAKGILFTMIKTDTQEKAESLPCASSIVSIFYNGQFVTHEFLTEKKFDKVMGKYL